MNKNIKDILGNLDFVLNSFGGAKVKYKNNTFDIAIVDRLDNKLFLKRFAELDSDCICYDIEYNRDCYLSPYWEYKNHGYATVINESSLHPKLGIERRKQRIEKANQRKDHTLKIGKHIDLLQDFVKNLNLN